MLSLKKAHCWRLQHPVRTLQHCFTCERQQEMGSPIISSYCHCSRYVCHNTASRELWASILLLEPRLSLQSVFGLIRQTQWRGKRGRHTQQRAAGRTQTMWSPAHPTKAAPWSLRYSETWWMISLGKSSNVTVYWWYTWQQLKNPELKYLEDLWCK